MHHSRSLRYFVFGLLLFSVLLPEIATAKTLQISPPGSGHVRALIIGIDRYQNARPLKGAAADARDIASALEAAGVSDLTVLIDENATRQKVDAGLMHLLEVALPGDLVILSLAGHGAQAPERVRGSEPDGMDEVFLLGGFSQSGRGNTERLIDDEINGWLSRLSKKGIDVLFVADTCHGGGMARRPEFGGEEQSYRFSGTVKLDADEDTPVASIADARVKVETLPHVTFLAAADKYNLAPEVRVPGAATKRGALSYAIARAIDEGRDGPVTRQQLFGFSRQVAYQYTETRQSIATEPQSEGAALEQVVFRLKTDGNRLASKQPAPVRLRIVGGDATLSSGIAPGDTPFRNVRAGEDADLIWDVGKGEAYGGSGDLIGACRTAAEVAPIVDLIGAINAIAKLTEMNYQDIRLLPSDSRFREGDIVVFRASGLAKKHLILFDIFGDGTVRFLYPRFRSDSSLISEDDFNLNDIHVRPPFGADHVTAIVSDNRLEDLERAVSALNDQKSAGKLAKLLVEAQQLHPDMRVGTAALFTAPR